MSQFATYRVTTPTHCNTDTDDIATIGISENICNLKCGCLQYDYNATVCVEKRNRKIFCYKVQHRTRCNSGGNTRCNSVCDSTRYMQQRKQRKQNIMRHSY